MQATTANNQTEVLHALLSVLDTGNSLCRCQAVRAIERLEPHDAESRRRLIGLLSDPDPDVRTDTAAALGNMEIGEATESLLDTVRRDHEGGVRIQAVIALSKIKSPNAVEPLIECFKADGYPELDYPSDDMEYSPCWEVQSQAMQALGQLRDHRAARPLMEVLESGEYDDLQESGFKVLTQLDEEKARKFLVRQLSHQSPRTRRRAAQALGSLPDRAREILDALTGALHDTEPTVRMSAAQSLATIDEPAVAADLTRLIDDPDAEVRAAVATILGEMQGPEILGRLHGLLEEPNDRLRKSMVMILGDIGDARSQEPLIGLLQTKDEQLLPAVLHALGQIGTPGPEQQIAGILASQDTHWTIRMQAAQALGSILLNAKEEANEDDGPSTSPRQVLAATVFGKNEHLASASLSALVNAYPEEAIAWLADVVRGQPLVLLREERGTTDTPEDTSLAEISCGDPATSTLASIVAGLPGEEPTPVRKEGSRTVSSLRVFAARLLGDVATPGGPGVNALIEAYQSDEIAIRREILIALGRIGDEAALPIVFEALGSTEPDVRLAAVDVLKEFDLPADARERIEALSVHPDPKLRSAALGVLGSGNVAKYCIYRALGDDDQQVCRTALQALSKNIYSDPCGERIFDLIFKFSGELSKEAGAALRRVGDRRVVARLLALLRDAEMEELHWLCIDALSEFSAAPGPATED